MEKCTLLFLWVSLSLSSVSALPRCERVKESKCSWECPEVNKVVNFRDNSEPIRYAWTFIATQSNGRMWSAAYAYSVVSLGLTIDTMVRPTGGCLVAA